MSEHGFRMVISSPDGTVFDGEIFMLCVRGVEGELAIMAGHAPLVTSVVACEGKTVLADDTERKFSVGGGLLSVTQRSVTLLTGSFAWQGE